MHKTCERCSKKFTCGISQEGISCWCMDLPLVKTIPDKYTDCLCSDCLMSFIKNNIPSTTPLLAENADYYRDENNNFVFTESYHRKRGYCCKNGCKHCPY